MSIQLVSHPCYHCQAMRLNDGFPCQKCGLYENRHIKLKDGRYVDDRYEPAYAPLKLRVRGHGAG